ncbi:uncharacterized protein TNIN_483721 [Trichonephila inaurata madagascariensis]|uniref:Uncharacterized protein n=1 Tax=Trichonephila inaurata madagascariensis TaxID=2747483 RepID=A0A8X6XUD4_9ARAC|nr:uncharacterized protein TNIN_483721 [Trichonephila inaurata madagascariensis]
MTLLCWIELLPIPGLTILSNSPAKCKPIVEKEQPGSQLKYQDNETQEKVESTRESETTNTDVKPRIYRLRNWKKDVSNEYFKKCPAPFDASSIKPMEKIREYNFTNNDSNGTDPTKIYYFPYRQKRSEQWIEPKETRPSKIRNSESNFIENSKSTPPLSEDSNKKTNDDYSTENFESTDFEIPKSYSFPIRRKRLQQWIEIQEKGSENSDVGRSVPPTRTSGHCKASKKDIRRRSFSGSEYALEKMDSYQSGKHKDFSQSVEISNISCGRTTNIELTKNGSTAFSRLKVGFANCLLKCKKDNSKLSIKSTDSKKRSLKNFF